MSTSSRLAIAISKHVSVDLSLADYQASGAFARTRSASAENPDHAQLSQLYAAGDWARFLAAAVKARQTILISGGTSTGKTTFLNALLREIDPAERLIAIEDTPELTIKHENALGLVAVRGCARRGAGQHRRSVDSLAQNATRSHRGRRGAWNGSADVPARHQHGSPGVFDDDPRRRPQRALEHLALMVGQTYAALRRKDVLAYATAAVDVTEQLARRSGHRQVTQVIWKR